MQHRCWNSLTVYGEKQALDLFFRSIDQPNKVDHSNPYLGEKQNTDDYVNFQLGRVILLPNPNLVYDIEEWKIAHWGCNGEIESPSYIRYNDRLEFKFYTDTLPPDKWVESVGTSSLYCEYDFILFSHCPDTFQALKIVIINGELSERIDTNSNTEDGSDITEALGFLKISLFTRED